MHSLSELVSRAESLATDVELKSLARRDPGTPCVGLAPAYVPEEIAHAAGAIPVHLYGGSPSLEVVRGDAFFQSAICHLPRSLLELGLAGHLDPLDLVVVPSTCDVLRNLTGMWRLLFPKKPVHFLELPQRTDESGVEFYREQLVELADAVHEATGRTVSASSLRTSISLFNERRRTLGSLEALRRSAPRRVPTSELYVVIRAGAVLPPEEHLKLLREYLRLCRSTDRPELDMARVVVSGAFCEAPPLGFVRTLERAGCAVVADDMLSGARWLRVLVSEEEEDPFRALAEAYAVGGAMAPCRFAGAQRRTDDLIHAVRDAGAQGVILAAPSFCDPALLDRPRLAEALERAGIPSIQLQYAENSVDYGSVREQAGTFADALRLWEAA